MTSDAPPLFLLQLHGKDSFKSELFFPQKIIFIYCLPAPRLLVELDYTFVISLTGPRLFPAASCWDGTGAQHALFQGTNDTVR